MPGRSEKIREGDPGITVDGKPLETHIEDKEKNELEESRKEEVGTKTKSKKKIRPKEKYEEDPRKVSKRVRRLSDFEIRKEYGVKAKPFPSLTKNVMYLIYNAGDALINSRAIAKELDKPLPDVSSCLSNIYKRLKDDAMIYRKKVGLAYNYCMTNEGLTLGFEELFNKYFPGPGGVRKKEPSKTELSLEDHRAMLSQEYSELFNAVMQRVEALEQDGLDDRVTKIYEQLRAVENEFLRLEDKVVSGTAPTNEFTINVRFLFGRA